MAEKREKERLEAHKKIRMSVGEDYGCLKVFEQAYYDDLIRLSGVEKTEQTGEMSAENAIRQMAFSGIPENDCLDFIMNYCKLKQRFEYSLDNNVVRGFLFGSWYDRRDNFSSPFKRQEAIEDFRARMKVISKIAELDMEREVKHKRMFFKHIYRPSSATDETGDVIDFASRLDSRKDVLIADDVKEKLGEILESGLEILGKEPVEELLKFLHSRSVEYKSTFAERAADCFYRIIGSSGSIGGRDETGKRGSAILHDLLFVPYMRSSREGCISSIIVGDTVSHFLNLDPELKTRRCTAGNGVFRGVSCQYPFHKDIKIIDLSFEHSENKVAEAILVDSMDRDGLEYSVVETAEAGKEAYLLPEYHPSHQRKKLHDFFGFPSWACFLLEEIVERAYKTEDGSVREKPKPILFNTTVDTKRGTNDFLTTAVELLDLVDLGIVRKTKPCERYEPNRRYKEELNWREFLTAIRWNGSRESKSVYLERSEFFRELHGEDFADVGVLPYMTYLGAWAPNGKTIDMIMKMFGDAFGNRITNSFRGVCNTLGLAPPKVNSFGCFRGNPYINNGCGYVYGFMYEVTEERYVRFKEKMKEVRGSVGLQEQHD